ncbi:hypothetical protein [Serratia proteamaculans]
MTSSVLQTYPMIFIHDIHVNNSAGDLFIITIGEINKSTYELDITYRNSKLGSSSATNLGNYTSADLAFASAINFISAHFNDPISSIDNPCNTPFISKKDQDEKLKNKGINISVTVNGK